MTGTQLPMPAWAPSALREARLGLAKRMRGAEMQQLQAFDWCAAMSKLLLAGLDRAEASTVCNNPEALWVLPRSRATYWDAINNHGASHWDGCEPCCAGLAYYDDLLVVVYDRQAVIATLQVAPIDSSVPVPESNWRIQAIESFDFLAQQDLGPSTPFYI